MRRFRFTTNAIFFWNDQKFRVIRLLPKGKVNIENVSTTGLVVTDLEELVELYYSGVIKPYETSIIHSNEVTEIDVLEWSDYTDKQRKDAEQRLEIIKPLLENPQYANWSVVQYVKMLQASSEYKNRALSVRSVYRWIKAYMLSGHDKRSLIMHTTSRGGKGKSRLGETDKIIDAVFQDMIFSRDGYGPNEARPKRPSGKHLHKEISLRVIEENTHRSTTNLLVCPSKRTIERRVNDLDEFDLFVARFGLAKAKAEFRQYGQLHNIEFMQRMEFDHTTLDVIIIDDEDCLTLGRPTLSKLNEFTTKGIYCGNMSFEKSYQTVKETLYKGILPKTNYRELYGTEHNPQLYGMFDQLVVDQGRELIGGDLKDSCEALGINLIVLEKREPQGKGAGESGFGVLNDLWHGMDGTTFSNVVERGDYDSVGKAALTLSELETAFYTYVCDLYPFEPHGFEQIYPSIELQKQIDNGYVPSLPFSPEELYIILGRTTFRTLQHYGIDINNLRYNLQGHNVLSKLRKKLQKMYGKKSHPKKLLKIKWHPDNMHHIHVFHPFEKKYIEVPALNQEYTRKVTYWKHRVIKREAKRVEKQIDDKALARAYRRIQNLIYTARKRLKLSARTKVGRWKHKTLTPPTPTSNQPNVNSALSESNQSLTDTDHMELYTDLGNMPVDDYDIGPNISDI
ncbi:MAG: hypothetical protein AAF846_21405 [Chloroflexota bacterium]